MPSKAPNAEQVRLDEDGLEKGTGSAGDPTFPSASGARCVRTTARTATRWSYFTARARALAGLPLGRGRASSGSCDRHHAAVLRARALERERPDPQGAPLRSHERRRQPRRGRQGVLLLPRRDADTLLHEVPLQVSAGGVSLCAADGGEPRRARATIRSTSCSTPASSTKTGTSTSSSSTPRPTPKTSCIRITVGQPGPERAALHVLPTLWFRNTWSLGMRARGPQPQARRCARRRGASRSRRTRRSGEALTSAASARAAASCSSPRTRRNAQRLFGPQNARRT